MPKLILITYKIEYRKASRCAFMICTENHYLELMQDLSSIQIARISSKEISWEQADLIVDLFGSNKLTDFLSLHKI
jgi:hypothetical protein